jgi:hypothetical protein
MGFLTYLKLFAEILFLYIILKVFVNPTSSTKQRDKKEGELWLREAM